jgi:hypothetical protein
MRLRTNKITAKIIGNDAGDKTPTAVFGTFILADIVKNTLEINISSIEIMVWILALDIWMNLFKGTPLLLSVAYHTGYYTDEV